MSHLSNRLTNPLAVLHLPELDFHMPLPSSPDDSIDLFYAAAINESFVTLLKLQESEPGGGDYITHYGSSFDRLLTACFRLSCYVSVALNRYVKEYEDGVFTYIALEYDGSSSLEGCLPFSIWERLGAGGLREVAENLRPPQWLGEHILSWLHAFSDTNLGEGLHFHKGFEPALDPVKGERKLVTPSNDLTLYDGLDLPRDTAIKHKRWIVAQPVGPMMDMVVASFDEEWQARQYLKEPRRA